MANRIRKQPSNRKAHRMNLAEELLILKMNVKFFETALASNDIELLLDVVVDLNESAQKLEKLTFDYANQADA